MAEGQDPAAAAALERAREAGFVLLRIPTPFAVGRVNCWLVETEPLTLIDTGPNSGKALDELERQLAAAGHAIEDLGLIVITHQHVDHTGLAEIVAERSGAEVAALGAAARGLANYAEDAELEDRFAGELMVRHGVPEDVVTALQSVSRSFRAWGSHVTVTRSLADGELLELGDRAWEVQHRPGHSPSDTLFWDAERKLLVAGDHLLAHISSNPLLARPLDGSPGRTRSLIDYMDSLARTRELPAELVLTGHGDPITDHVALIDARFEMTARRKEKILGIVRERPRSAHEIALEIWGNVAVTQAFLTLSEVIGHLDLLVREGAVRELSEGERSLYEAA
jgi:glyoxylase-like metal-dependent hydrolase (beta-lactamase superfamily II)